MGLQPCYSFDCNPNRHCGYLALVAGVVTEADFVFIPEWPPEADWKSRMCTKLKAARDDAGQRLNIIIVAEGAIDRNGDKITCEGVSSMEWESLTYEDVCLIFSFLTQGEEGRRGGAEAGHEDHRARPRPEGRRTLGLRQVCL